jgi:hypothetical protein
MSHLVCYEIYRGNLVLRAMFVMETFLEMRVLQILFLHKETAIARWIK